MFQTHIPADFLRDESRKCGTADVIAFPQSVAELKDAVREAAAQGHSLTVQGARTGISAGAVPDGGAIVNLSKMDRVLGLRTDAAGNAFLRVQPGLPLIALRRHLSADCRLPIADCLPDPSSDLRPPTSRFFFPPDPTETSASLGGMASCNASGACSYAYGPTRDHIAGLTVVLADGETLTLQRGHAFATGHRFSLTTDSGRVLSGELPDYALPAVKNAAGYWVRPGMDLLDLFIGCEGTLGIVAELELRLMPKPYKTLGTLCYLDSESPALELVDALRRHAAEAGPHTLVALEYFDEGSLRLIRASAPHTGLLLPPPRPHWSCALYVEWALRSDENTPEPLLCRLLDACGGHAEDTWVAADAPSLEKLKAFRHAVPERVNAIIAERKRRYPQLTKLGTDLSVPDDKLKAVMRLYRDDLQAAGLEHVIFGHIGNNHVHVNILPRDMSDYAAGKALYHAWAQQVVAWGGSVSAEHGIGRLKKDLLAVMYGSDGIAAMRQLKAVFDPANRLNLGRLF
jgi:D-lactate dehydrogenase (cytochrome)